MWRVLRFPEALSLDDTPEEKRGKYQVDSLNGVEGNGEGRTAYVPVPLGAVLPKEEEAQEMRAQVLDLGLNMKAGCVTYLIL